MEEQKIMNIIKLKEKEILELKRLLKTSQYNHTQSKKKFKELKGKYNSLLNNRFEEFCKLSS